MKKIGLFMVCILFLLTGCSAKPQIADATSVTNTPNPIVTVKVVATEVLIPVPTETLVPTAAPSPTSVPEELQKLRSIMNKYGQVDEYYLSASYWERLEDNISKYGKARRIVPLEFHGDNYSMFDSSYEMNPARFEVMMRYLLDNDYHFVTGPELVGFLEGWLDLPSRSIILTTDSGGASLKSFSRIIPLFQQLEKEYGVRPYMLSFIWTHGMLEEETVGCIHNQCWEAFRTARDSGYFTIGSHTQTHRHFDELTLADTVWDLTVSSDKIRDNLGLTVYGITWPFENCSPFLEKLDEMGYEFAFGGCTRMMEKMYVYEDDNMPLCLPRMFPPNTDGYSGRPSGLTLEQMLLKAESEHKPLE